MLCTSLVGISRRANSFDKFPDAPEYDWVALWINAQIRDLDDPPVRGSGGQ